MICSIEEFLHFPKTVTFQIKKKVLAYRLC